MKWQFNPNDEYGQSLPVKNGLASYRDVDKFVYKTLHRLARRVLPKGTVYELSGVVALYGYFDRAVCWYYRPGLKARPAPKRFVYDPVTGRIPLGRFRV